MLEWLPLKDGPFANREDAYTRTGGVLPPGTQLLPSSRAGEPTLWFLLARNAVVRGTDVRDAQAVPPYEGGGWATRFVLRQEAARRFEQYTATNIGNRAAIVLDRHIVSIAVIEGKIGDTGIISNIGSRQEAADLALSLRAGALPASVTYSGERTVGPSLGADSIRQGFEAGISGLGAVGVAMTTHYKRSGVHALVALALNGLILLAALSYFGAVLTLPGIAGLILTIGMAVDSNVLIFERIREELRAGSQPAAAVKSGFDHAFLTIVDTHVTTVVACGCLFIFGTTAVQGFAVTLTIGLIANLFTSVFVSRLIFDWELWSFNDALLSI